MTSTDPHPRTPCPPPARFRVGRASVVSLTDAVGSFTGFAEAFPTAAPTTRAAVAARHPELFDGPAWVLAFRCFLVSTPDALVLVDTGVGPPGEGFLPGRQGWLPLALAQAGVSPVDVDLVVITHLHEDHVGWNVGADGEPTFPRARYAVPARDWEAVRTRDGSRVAAAVRPLEERGVLRTLAAGPGEELVAGVTAFATPGHTPGHQSVRVESGGQVAVVLGDLAVHPAQVAEPDLPYAYEADTGAARRSRREVLARVAGERALACASHLPGAGVGRIRPGGDVGYLWHDAEPDSA